MTKELIFLSHDPNDDVDSEEIDNLLQERKIVKKNDAYLIIDPLSDRIKSDTNMRRLIKTRIEAASMIVILATDQSNSSEWVNYEAGIADALGKKIIVIDRGVVKQEFLSKLKEFQHIKLKPKANGDKGTGFAGLEFALEYNLSAIKCFNILAESSKGFFDYAYMKRQYPD